MKKSFLHKDCPESGFTLIELSIVLVIIGLIIGSVLVGQDLIKGAEVRATISQIEKYNTAVNTFYGKYGALPGDMNATTATRFGFTSRPASGVCYNSSCQGQGDGNGVIEGLASCEPDPLGAEESAGETVMFWVDLTSANGLNLNMIDGNFKAASMVNCANLTGSPLNTLYPQAKLGRGNYIYVNSGGNFWINGYSTEIQNNGLNYFVISALTNSYPLSNFSITAQQAYNIDKKVDDGFPMTGHVIASFESGYYDQTPYASTDNATTCFNTATSAGAYSIAYNGGTGPNCGLMIQFQ